MKNKSFPGLPPSFGKSLQPLSRVFRRYFSEGVFIASHHYFAPHNQIGLDENFVIKVERQGFSNVVLTGQLWRNPMRALPKSGQPKVIFPNQSNAMTALVLPADRPFYRKEERNLKPKTVEKLQRMAKDYPL